MIDYTDFFIWLVNKKNMKQRSAKDVISRCKRASKILDTEIINSDSLGKLLQNDEYKANSMFVKSQLKRAVILLEEFKENK